MMTWLTRISLLDSVQDLETPLLAQACQESHDLAHAMVLGKGIEDLTENHPVVRMWLTHEIALMAYCSAASAELNRRGVGNALHYAMGRLLRELQIAGEDIEFSQPPWLADTDVLRSHRSNMARRWPGEYGDKWQGTPERWPYLWPFATDEDGSYGLFLSGHDKTLLASGERTLPKSIKQRIENL
jgi:hypothetical protein